MEKVKIVLDADVIIHFYKGGRLTYLPEILNEYEHVVLSYVREEILHDIRNAMDHQIAWLRNITLVDFAPQEKWQKSTPCYAEHSAKARVLAWHIASLRTMLSEAAI